MAVLKLSRLLPKSLEAKCKVLLYVKLVREILSLLSSNSGSSIQPNSGLINLFSSARKPAACMLTDIWMQSVVTTQWFLRTPRTVIWGERIKELMHIFYYISFHFILFKFILHYVHFTLFNRTSCYFPSFYFNSIYFIFCIFIFTLLYITAFYFDVFYFPLCRLKRWNQFDSSFLHI